MRTIAWALGLAVLGPVVSLRAGDPADAATVLFVDRTLEAGLTSTFTSGNTHTGGVGWVDYNNDFWPDLFLTNGSGLPHYLYRNNGDGTFTDVSSLVPKPSLALEDAGVVFGDLDNDGDQDIVVIVDNPTLNFGAPNPADGGPNLLYRNLGDGTFAEVGLAAGIVDPLGRRNIVGALADFDRDSYLDLYIGNWRLGAPLEPTNYDRMLYGSASGTFTDMTATTRTNGYGRDALAILAFDADMDNWPDLYVGNTPPTAGVDSNDVFYHNANAGGWFCDRTGNPRVFGDDAFAAMGIDVGDIDNDGDWDLYITDEEELGTIPKGNVLYVSNGDATFQDNTCDVAGVCADFSWPTNFFDVDRNGWIDLYVGTTEIGKPDYLYLNDGDGTFTNANVSTLSGNEARGGSIADFDGDGDVDLFVVNYNQNSRLFQNFTITTDGWLEIKLLGQVSNRSAIGATVFVDTGGMVQMRRVSGCDSAHSQQELILHFGIGTATTVDVAVEWPSGITQEFLDVPTGQLVFVDEIEGLVAESLSVGNARWTASTRELKVSLRTNLGGRSVIACEGFGAVPFDAALGTYTATFRGVVLRPGVVSLTTPRGSLWSLPVDVAP